MGFQDDFAINDLDTALWRDLAFLEVLEKAQTVLQLDGARVGIVGEFPVQGFQVRPEEQEGEKDDDDPHPKLQVAARHVRRLADLRLYSIQSLL